jgi:hypothetical protein
MLSTLVARFLILGFRGAIANALNFSGANSNALNFSVAISNTPDSSGALYNRGAIYHAPNFRGTPNTLNFSGASGALNFSGPIANTQLSWANFSYSRILRAIYYALNFSGRDFGFRGAIRALNFRGTIYNALRFSGPISYTPNFRGAISNALNFSEAPNAFNFSGKIANAQL